MRKSALVLVALVVILGLTGCSAEVDGTSVEGIFNKTVKASQGLNSFHCELGVSNKITTGDEEAETDTILIIDYIKSPLAMYQRLDMGEFGIDVEMYLVEEGFYINNSMSDQWMKTPIGLYGSLINSAQGQTDIKKILGKLKKYISKFSWEEKDDCYLLSFEAQGEDYKELVKTAVSASMPVGTPLESMLDNLTIDLVKYSFLINKENFYLNDFSIENKISLTVEEKSVHMEQLVSGKYSRFNDIDKIVVPDKVREQAVDMTK